METIYPSSPAPAEYPAIIIGKLMTISGILEREGNRLLLPYHLNQQQFSILFEIAKAKKVRQKDMVNRLMLERAHVSKVVKKLQNMGLVDINPVPDDKRSFFLKPTGEGKELVDKCRVLFRKWNQEWFGSFSIQELDQMLISMDRLQKAFLSKYTENPED